MLLLFERVPVAVNGALRRQGRSYDVGCADMPSRHRRWLVNRWVLLRTHAPRADHCGRRRNRLTMQSRHRAQIADELSDKEKENRPDDSDHNPPQIWLAQRKEA